jgi:hypothetical protein
VIGSIQAWRSSGRHSQPSKRLRKDRNR